MKKRLFKKNQIIITALAVMIAVAGYINYADKSLNSKSKTSNAATTSQNDKSTAKNDTMLKDIKSLDTDITDATTNAADDADKADNGTANNSPDASADTPGEAVLTGASAYLAQARIDREQTRSQNKETLLSIINNDNLTETERQSAIQSMVEMTDAVEKEAAAELLLEAKGFEDVVVNMAGETVDVVVPQSQLGDDQRVQIEDIVKRKTGAAIDNIVITPID